jgi:hypothetical protein
MRLAMHSRREILKANTEEIRTLRLVPPYK